MVATGWNLCTGSVSVAPRKIQIRKSQDALMRDVHHFDVDTTFLKSSQEGGGLLPAPAASRPPTPTSDGMRVLPSPVAD